SLFSPFKDCYLANKLQRLGRYLFASKFELSEIQACERLLKYTRDENDKIILENEIAELKLALDLLQ
ncbi:MAG: hypothetical protein WB706_08535, partial [Nitrososphaeraceae archaeon]